MITRNFFHFLILSPYSIFFCVTFVLLQKVWDRHREKESVKQYHITLKDHTKEFGVYVTISYNPYSNKVNKVIVVEEYS